MQSHQDWVDWAVEAILAGYDSRSLRVLAGLQPPFDDSEINRLSKNAFIELNIPPLTRGNCVPHYVVPILRRILDGTLTQKEALNKLNDLYLATGHDNSLKAFYLLYFAACDLETSEVQRYWKGANRNNINEIIDAHIQDWLNNYRPIVPV